MNTQNAVIRYNHVRSELVRLYKIITKRTFILNAKRSIFLTTEQLEAMEKNPPICGLDRYNTVGEMPVTIAKMVLAQEIIGDDLVLAFRYPKKDIPVVYDTIQNYIKYWTEIMLNASGFKTATVYELELLENIAKGLYYSYSYYKREMVKEDLNKQKASYVDPMVNLYLGIIKHGRGMDNDNSFYSYLDAYKEKVSEMQGHFSVQSFTNTSNMDYSKNFIQIPELHKGL